MLPPFPLGRGSKASWVCPRVDVDCRSRPAAPAFRWRRVLPDPFREASLRTLVCGGEKAPRAGSWRQSQEISRCPPYGGYLPTEGALDRGSYLTFTGRVVESVSAPLAAAIAKTHSPTLGERQERQRFGRDGIGREENALPFPPRPAEASPLS